MDGVNRVWKVVQQYNGQSIIPIIILIGILFFGSQREKKHKLSDRISWRTSSYF